MSNTIQRISVLLLTVGTLSITLRSVQLVFWQVYAYYGFCVYIFNETCLIRYRHCLNVQMLKNLFSQCQHIATVIKCNRQQQLVLPLHLQPGACVTATNLVARGQLLPSHLSNLRQTTKVAEVPKCIWHFRS